MAAKSFVDFDGLQYYDTKLKASLANKTHSYTTAASAAKNWYRIANATTSPIDTAKPLHVQFRLRAYNSAAGVGYWQTWFVDATISGQTSGLHVLGESGAPFSQIRVLYENTAASVTSSIRPALDIYLNYVLTSATVIEIEELNNSGFEFVADGALSASTVPSGYENRAVGPYASGISVCGNADYAGRTALNRANFTANFTLADNNTYRGNVLNCTGSITVTAPSINSVWSWFIIKNANTTSGVITIHPSSTSVLIDGISEDITLQPNEYILLQSKAANNYTIVFDGRWMSKKANKATTIAGYGITDAKIASGTITLGSATITPLTSASTLDATKLSGTIPSGCYTNTVYTHPTTSGNKHVPSGGSSGQFLGWDSDGTAKWVNNPNTNTDTLMTQNVSTTNATYPVLTVATANATANLGAKTGIFGSGVKINPSTSVITAKGLTGTPSGTTYVAAIKEGGGLVSSTTTGYGCVWNAPTKDYRVGCSTYPSSNNEVLVAYSITNANVSSGTNTVAKSLKWDAGTGALTANSFAGDGTAVTLGTASRAVVTDGNKKLTVSSATAAEVGYLSGVTSAIQTQLNGKAASSHGTHVSFSTANPADIGTASPGGSSTTTVAKSDHVHALPNSGVTAGSYGPSAAASPAHGGKFNVPYITVDAQGRITAASTKEITLPSDNNTDTLMTQNVSTTASKYPVLLCPTADATANQGAKTGIFPKSVWINPSTNEVISGGANAFRMVQGNYGAFWRNDGSNCYFLLTASGDQYGSWTSARPITINNSTGVCSINGNAATAGAFSAAKSVTLTGDITGTASSAAGWSIETKRRSCLLGQSSSTTTNPWYKVATCAMTVENSDSEVIFAVEDTYSSHKYGFLKVHLRTNGSKVLDSSSSVVWLTHTGFALEDFVLVLPAAASSTAELWTKIATAWMHRRFTVVSEGTRTTTENKWTLLDASSAGQAESITTAGTQKTSVLSGYASNVTGTVAIANGGTGATTRLNALKALTNESVGTNATYFLTITNSWGKGGYTSVADAKTVLGLKSAAYTESSAYAAASHGTHVTFSTANPANIGTASAGGSSTTTVAKSDHVHALPNSGVTAGSYGPSDNATPGYGATFNVPYITVDAQGRITAAATKTVKIPASDNTNTDTLMTQNVSTTNATYPILAVATANATANQGAKTGIFGSGVKLNPSTSTVVATTFDGTATKATGDSNGRNISTGYMWRGSYERIEGTSSAKKDLNNYKTAGFYNVKTVNVLNVPTGIGSDAVLLNYPWNIDNYLTQEITETAASSGVRRWIRKLNSSTWSAWSEVAMDFTPMTTAQIDAMFE